MVKPSGRRSFLTDLPATPLNLRRRGAFQSPTELLSMKIRPSAAAVGALTVAASMLVACDRSSGQGQEATGHIESGLGSLTGDSHLKREGKTDEVVGGVKSAVGDVAGAVKDASH